MFGNTSNFGNSASTFGNVGFTSPTPNPNVFGQAPQTPVNSSLFGSGMSGFNQQPKPTFGSSFGAPQTQGMFGQANRLPAPSTGSLFSGQTATVSPFSTAQAQVPTNGTSIQFSAINGSDTMMKNGTPTQISTRHQCITCMKEYENKSLEELRMEDYQLNRKGPQQGLFGAIQPQQSTGLFPSLSTASAPFGQTTSFGGTNTSGGGLFNNINAPKPAGSFFSTPATSSAFGANTAFSFNNPTSQPTSVFGANNNAAPTGGLGTSAFAFGQPQNQATNLFNQKPLASVPTTGFGGFGTSAFTNTSTANKPTVGFSSGFGTNTTPSFGATTAPTFGTGTGSLFGSQPQNKPFSFGTFPSQAQPTQPTFGAPTNSFSFNPTTTSAPTLGFGSSTNTFGAPTLGSSTNTFSASSFGSAPQPTLGFGQNTTSSTGFGAFTPSLNFSQPVQQQQQPNAAIGALGFATTPYKDSPLFYNLIANRDLENMVKPTSPSAQRAIKEASRRRTSTSLSFPSNFSQRNATFPSAGSKSFNKSIFDGFEEDDKGISLDILSPKTSVKKLSLKTFKNQTTTSHRHSISFAPSPRVVSQTFGDNGLNDSVISEANVSSGSGLLGNNSPVNNILSPERDRDAIVISQQFQVHSGDGDYEFSNGLKEKNKCRVISTRAGYYIQPSLEGLDKLADDNGDCWVKDFVIGRQNHGEIRFLGEVNVADVNIDEIVHFRHKEVVVYPEDNNKPPLGEGLNCPAIVSLERVWPIDKITKNPIKFPAKLQTMGYEDILRKACQRLGADFIAYAPETGLWTFKVPHFSKYSICEQEEAKASLFNGLSLDSNDVQKFKAMPRVIFGPSGSFMTVTNSISSNSPRISVNMIKSYQMQISNPVHIEVLEEQTRRFISNNYPKTTHQIDALQGFNILYKNNPLTYEWKREVMMWELFHILWSCEEISYEASKTLEYRIKTRDKVSEWLSKHSDFLFPDLGGSDSSNNSVLSLLKAGHREDACNFAVKQGNYYLALIIAQAPLAKAAASNCEEMLSIWEQEGAVNFLPSEIRTIYRLCSGSNLLDQVDLEKMTTSEWLQHFAIYIWYCCPHNIPVEEAVMSFQQLLKNELAKETQWSEDEIGHLSFPSTCDSSVPNLCIQLLKLFCFDGYPLEKVVDPRTYSEDCMDYKLSWFLMENFIELGYGPSELAARISTSFAHQLEQIGLYPKINISKM